MLHRDRCRISTPGRFSKPNFCYFRSRERTNWRYFPFASYRVIQLPYSGLSEEILVKPFAGDPSDVIRTSEIWLCVPVSRRESLRPPSKIQDINSFSKYVHYEQVIEEIELCRSRETEFTWTGSRSAQRAHQVARLFIDEFRSRSGPEIYPGRTIKQRARQPWMSSPSVFSRTFSANKKISSSSETDIAARTGYERRDDAKPEDAESYFASNKS